MSYLNEVNLERDYVMRTFGRSPVEFVEGKGMLLYDDEGREYLDFLSGIGVTSLGHCHPRLVSAVADQAAKLMHVSNYFYIEKRGEVARILSDLLNDKVDPSERMPWKTFFANSGAEANECAIKLARLFARKRAEQLGRDVSDAPRLIVTLEKSSPPRRRTMSRPLKSFSSVAAARSARLWWSAFRASREFIPARRSFSPPPGS